jgi:cell wall-associated NlpC family hydrolase
MPSSQLSFSPLPSPPSLSATQIPTSTLTLTQTVPPSLRTASQTSTPKSSMETHLSSKSKSGTSTTSSSKLAPQPAPSSPVPEVTLAPHTSSVAVRAHHRLVPRGAEWIALAFLGLVYTKPLVKLSVRTLVLYSLLDLLISSARTTSTQYPSNKCKRFLRKSAKPGDLLFWGCGENEGIHHVGIYSKPGYIVHAPKTGDKVKEAKIWTQGICPMAVR